MATSRRRESTPASEATEFYTRLRHPGRAEDHIAEFAASLRSLLGRMAADLHSPRRGPFHSGSALAEPLAAAAERHVAHVGALEKLLLAVPAGAGGEPLRNAFANFVADANLAALAGTQAGAPKSAESKFDQGKGGSIIDSMTDGADKLNDLGEVLVEEFPLAKTVFGVGAILLRDIGIFGKLAAAEAGGNEATQQIEAKLDSALPKIDGLRDGQQAIDRTLTRIDETATEMRQEVGYIEYKADTLGDLLGRTLVGETWIVDPRRTITAPNKVPPRSVKDEMHDLEALIRLLIDLINRPPPEPPLPPPTGTPPETPPPPVLAERRLKKIYVYAEDRFAPASASQRRTIDVRTPAFDLSGWLDLSRMRTGDVFEVQVRVSLANRSNVLWARTRFTTGGLKHFAEFARGQNTIVGNAVRIVLRQPTSADQFATPVEVAYQFVVESQ
jgi:hypothetical protein